MLKKYFLIILTFLLLTSIASVIGCEKASITKIYVNEDNPNEYLELKPDGTYYLYEEGMGLTGEWEVKGNELRLSWMGFVITAEIKGNKIIDDEGKIWVRKSNNFTSQLTKIESPSEVIKKFFRAIEEGDYYKAIDCVASNVKLKEELDIESFNEARAEMRKHGGIKKIDIIDEKIEGEHAEVCFKIEYRDGTIINIDEPCGYLVKEGNKWKITEE